jgi:hypothetical protein
VDSFEEVLTEIDLPVLGPQEGSRVGGVSQGLTLHSLFCAGITTDPSFEPHNNHHRVWIPEALTAFALSSRTGALLLS